MCYVAVEQMSADTGWIERIGGLNSLLIGNVDSWCMQMTTKERPMLSLAENACPLLG